MHEGEDLDCKVLSVTILITSFLMGVESEDQFLLSYLMKFCPVFLGFFAIIKMETHSVCLRHLPTDSIM